MLRYTSILYSLYFIIHFVPIFNKHYTAFDEFIFIYLLQKANYDVPLKTIRLTVADSGIYRREGGGAPTFFRNLYSLQPAFIYALEGSGGMPSTPGKFAV